MKERNASFWLKEILNHCQFKKIQSDGLHWSNEICILKWNLMTEKESYILDC